MDNQKYENGIKNLKAINEDGVNGVINSLKDIAPDIGNYTIEFAFGDIFEREGLTLQERQNCIWSKTKKKKHSEPLKRPKRSS